MTVLKKYDDGLHFRLGLGTKGSLSNGKNPIVYEGQDGFCCKWKLVLALLKAEREKFGTKRIFIRNLKVVEVGKGLSREVISSYFPAQVLPSVGFQCHIQAVSECLQGWRLQPLLAASSSAQAASQQKSASWCSEGASCVSVCACGLWVCHWEPLKRDWLCPLCTLLSGIHAHW